MSEPERDGDDDEAATLADAVPAPADGISRRRFLGGAIVLGGAAGLAVVGSRLASGQADQPRQPYRGTLRWIGHC